MRRRDALSPKISEGVPRPRGGTGSPGCGTRSDTSSADKPVEGTGRDLFACCGHPVRKPIDTSRYCTV